MNIFYLDKNPVKCAEMHLDKHVVKMILEYAQLLSTAHRIIDGRLTVGLSESGRKRKQYILDDKRDEVLYSATHINHPSAIWARQTSCNYEWLYQLFCATCDEYTHRYKKVHLTDAKLRNVLKKHPKGIGRSKIWVAPTPAMPDECKVPGDPLASYKRYYIDKKADMAKWTNREPPEWFINGVKEKHADVRVPLQELRERFRKVLVNKQPKRSRATSLS